jgi:hypothetical protein
LDYTKVTFLNHSIRQHLSTYTHTRTHTHARTRAHTHACTRAHTRRPCTHSRAHTHTHTHTLTHAHAHTRTRTHSRARAHTHAHTHTCDAAQLPPLSSCKTFPSAHKESLATLQDVCSPGPIRKPGASGGKVTASWLSPHPVRSR